MRSNIMKMEILNKNVLCALFFTIMLCSKVTGYNVDTSFPIIYSSSPGNYFGFTVALHRNRVGPLALVGAPRANLTILRELHQPGALYRCPALNGGPCEEVIFETKGNTPTGQGSELSYHDKKDDMWLGVSLDVMQNTKNNNIVTCGHLWKNQGYRHHYLTNGVCYVINSDLDLRSVEKLVPLVHKSKQALNSRIYYYAFGQVGTSAAFSEDGKHLLLGAPGFYDWAGTVVSYPSDSRHENEMYTNPIIPDPPGGQTAGAYIGYSVSSGKFYDTNDIFFAVGAPRDGNSHGRVYIFRALKPSANKISVHQKKEGMQFGEYFGATVLGMNLNTDSYTDLLVGAPFSSTESGGDEGKVYVYISNGLGLQPFAELRGGNKPNARFGTSIANLGDLNQDGFNDVAIGAPYENNGAVYIYHGTRNGLNKRYVQRILASEINPYLSGFGIHIARGLDIDSNQYPDVLVGSYASSNAVLFRTRPVMQLFSKLIFSPKQINTNVTECEFQNEKMPCVNVTACLWYAGKHVPLSLEFKYDIFVEHRSQTNLVAPRGFFLQNGRQVTVINQKSTLEVGFDKCVTSVLYIRPEIKDVITPIQILYRYNLTEPVQISAGFNKSFPIIDPLSPTNITSAVTFQTGCGRDYECLSDLIVSAKILGNPKNAPLIIGENDTLTLIIDIVNRGEPAYLSELFIHLPEKMLSINQDFCSTLNDQQKQQSNASLVCDLGNPLPKDKEVRIQIKLDIKKIPTEKKKVFIYLKANTASTEISPRNNNFSVPIYFKAVADISITGKPSHEQILYEEEMGTDVVSISHIYSVRNYGPSSLKFVDIVLNMPTSLKRKDGALKFLIFTDLEADSGEPKTIPAECNDTYLQIKQSLPEVKPRGEVFVKDDELIAHDEGNISKPNISHSLDLDLSSSLDKVQHTSRSRRSDKNKAGVTKRKDIVINCETAECMAIKCSASPFEDISKYAKITVSVQVNLSILNKYLDPWYRIEFVTSGEVFIRGDDGNIQPIHQSPDKTTVKTAIVLQGLPQSEEIAQWIIFVSIGAGILLLLIILILLVKFGFFKRKQKEKMQEMMTEAETKEYGSYDERESNEKDALN